MGKRKPDGALITEPSPKIRRVSPALGQEEHLDASVPDLPVRFEAQSEEALSNSGSLPLTKENLRRLEDMTGSRGGSSRRESGTGSVSEARTHSTTDVRFEEGYRRNGGLDPFGSSFNPPSSLPQQTAYKDQSRGSASPPHSTFVNYGKTTLAKSLNERRVESAFEHYVWQPTTFVQKNIDEGYIHDVDQQWTNFPQRVGFNDGLSNPKPDRTEGYEVNRFPPIIHGLKGAVLVRDKPDNVALPHFSVEYKTKSTSMHQAQLQAGYDGAAMVYARNIALAAIGQPDPPRHSAIVTVITNGDTWKAFSHYAHENEKTKRLEYYQCILDHGIMSTYADFKRARKVMRNLQDYAREQATDLKNRLQEHYDLYDSFIEPQPAVSSRASDAPSKTSSAGPSSKQSNSMPPPSRPVDKGKAVVSKKPMPPPLSRSSGASSTSSGDHAKVPPRAPSSQASDRRPKTPSSSTSSLRSGEPRPSQDVPTTDTRAPPRKIIGPASRERESSVASSGSSQRQIPGQDQHRAYRDRDIQPVQTRRSNSPERNKPPRAQDRDRDRTRRDDKPERSSASASSSNTSITRVSDGSSARKLKVNPPPRVKDSSTNLFTWKPQPKGKQS